ncbi:STAS domain-containing protein [Streptomycetaceae bacterium NBC_01309]
MIDGITVRTETMGAVTRIVVGGEVDWDTADGLRNALTAALAVQPPPVRVDVDMAAVDFCDSAGLRALIAAWKLGAAQGTAVAVSATSPQVAGLLDITGLAQALASP